MCIFALSSSLSAAQAHSLNDTVRRSTGILLAVFLSSLLVGILSSAVDTIIVCYAEAPTELQHTHPILAEEMEQAWTEAWRDPQSGLLLISLGAGPGLI